MNFFNTQLERKNDTVTVGGYWNEKTYSSSEGYVRIYVDNKEYHVTKESLDKVISKNDHTKKSVRKSQIDNAIKTLSNLMGEMTEVESHRTLALLLKSINNRNVINDKTSSNCHYSQMLNKMEEQAILTYKKY